jgi:hypothetical protein
MKPEIASITGYMLDIWGQGSVRKPAIVWTIPLASISATADHHLAVATGAIEQTSIDRHRQKADECWV